MDNPDNIIFPNTERQINVLRRYLHILALLQFTPESGTADGGKNETWNAKKLAELLTEEEYRHGSSSPLEDSQIRKYITENIEPDLGIDIDRAQGKPSMSVAEDISPALQLSIARLYADFVIQDTTRDLVLKKFINSMPDRALWMLARIYFAVIEKRMICFDYTTNAGRIICAWKVRPYYLLFRNNNLYLAAYDPVQDKNLSLIANRIKDLYVVDKGASGEWTIPPVEDLYGDSLSAFIGDHGETLQMKIRYSKSISNAIDQILSSLDPETAEIDNGEYMESVFTIADSLYLCRQLVLFGKAVEILEPVHVRREMIEMLEESLSVYRNG